MSFFTPYPLPTCASFWFIPVLGEVEILMTVPELSRIDSGPVQEIVMSTALLAVCSEFSAATCAMSYASTIC